MKTLILTLVISCCAFGQQTNMLDLVTHHDFVPLAAVPTVLTDALVPSVGTPSRVIIKSMYFVNTNATTIVTVTVTCKATGTVLVKAAIPGVTAGGNNVPVQFPADGVSCQGGLQWVADVAGLNGLITGVY